MNSGVSSELRYPALRDLSPGAQAAAAWFKALARALNTCRLYHVDNPVVLQIRHQLHEQLLANLEAHGAWRLRVTPVELWLVDEPILHPITRPVDELPSKEELLPFTFYRDGIRGLAFHPGVSVADFDALFNSMIASGRGPLVHDDLVTLLWQANPQRILVEATPVTQTIYLSSRRVEGGGGGGRGRGLAFNWSPSGDEIRADIGQFEGMAQGLHLDTFDDWPLPTTFVDVPAAFAVLNKGMQFVRSILLNEWAAERSADWKTEVPGLFRMIHDQDPTPDTRAALSQSLVTWVAGAMQRCAWDEARHALDLLDEFDPGGDFRTTGLSEALGGLDGEDITQRLDEAEDDDQVRFFALGVALGRPALDLGCTVLAHAQRARTRAAACTMLGYLCHEQPDLLAPYLADSRWYVVRNTVFVLGQIGGPDVVEMLQIASQHQDARVRRQVVNSLGNVPPTDRLQILTRYVRADDNRLVATALAMLGRQRGREVTRVLVHQIQAPDFESRHPDYQRMLLQAVAETGDDDAVPALQALVCKGGWFARATLERQAAARALVDLGTPAALQVLEDGLRSPYEAVRSTCLEAISGQSHP